MILDIENHHNFAWKETHGGRETIVHRKGATPAGAGVLGIIPGSMATPGYVVRGKGQPDSLHSALHGAGRVMSRTKALQSFTWSAVKKQLAERGVDLLSAGLDEVPGVYKDIEAVMTLARRVGLAGGYIQVDETPIAYLEPGHGSTRQNYLWTYVCPVDDVLFDSQTGRGPVTSSVGSARCEPEPAAWCAGLTPSQKTPRTTSTPSTSSSPPTTSPFNPKQRSGNHYPRPKRGPDLYVRLP